MSIADYSLIEGFPESRKSLTDFDKEAVNLPALVRVQGFTLPGGVL